MQKPAETTAQREAARPRVLLGRNRREAEGSPAPDVLLWTADAAWAEAVRDAHQAEGLLASMVAGPELRVAPGGQRQVAVFDLVRPPVAEGEDALAVVERLALLYPQLVAVLAVDAESVEVYRRALQVGARAVAVRSGPPEPVLEAVRAAREAVRSGGAAADPAQARKPALVWAVFGTKGGLGKTTLAVNLAVAMAARRRQAALLDLNVGFGSAHVFLDLEPRRPVSELLSDVRRLDGELLESYMLRHRSGLRLLPAAVRAEEADFVTAAHVTRILEVASELFQHVVLDLPATFHAAAQAALRRADTVLLVTGADLAGLAATRAALAGLTAVQVDPGRVRLVVRAGERGYGLTRKDIETALGMPVWAQVPWDEAATTPALNQGVPAVTAHVRSRYAAAVARLVALLEKQR